MPSAPPQGEIITIRLRIIGQVQGVGYRAWCVHTARRLGLQGWVRNLTDGSVEALVRGSEDAVNTLVAATQVGPTSARVTEVRRTDIDPADRAAWSLPPGFHEAATSGP
ncbi:MAG: acylphosphatase [Rhodospirillaceae bacterium]|nr:MAG: acylphosphatase [Rhodospirillaceae bacterium]